MSRAACRHGFEGLCVDELTPEARESLDFAHRHAYEYMAASGDREAAEDYSSWYVRTYFVDSLEDGPNHRTGAEAWRASSTPATVKPEPGAGRRIDAARRANVRAAERAAARRIERQGA